MPRLINHPDRNPPDKRAGRTYAVVGKGGATVRAAASLRSPVVGTVERGGKVSLTFAEGFCVYVVYLTSEPASLVDFGGD